MTDVTTLIAVPGDVSAAHAFKIVVTGPVGSGKTTFINTISEIQTVRTEARMNQALGDKDATTVGIDFGRITLKGGLELYLFGTPGQERFTFMWDIVSQGMLGLIVLLDCERPETYPTARSMLEYFRARGDVPVIVAANKVADFAGERDRVSEALSLAEDDFVVPTNALDRGAVKQTLIELLELVVASLL
jgi:small GTP-binding protein